MQKVQKDTTPARKEKKPKRRIQQRRMIQLHQESNASLETIGLAGTTKKAAIAASCNLGMYCRHRRQMTKITSMGLEKGVEAWQLALLTVEEEVIQPFLQKAVAMGLLVLSSQLTVLNSLALVEEDHLPANQVTLYFNARLASKISKK